MTTLDAWYSGDPDDAFAWFGILEGLVADPAFAIAARATTVHAANEGCLRGIPDLAAISAAAYPWIAEQYRVLDAGASVGRSYGPLLVGTPHTTELDLREGRVAVGGFRTTGGALFRLLYPNAQTIELPWREIPDAIRRGTVHAGVCIHETLVCSRDAPGLRPLRCLGAAWTRHTALPLPVGLVVARRSLGPEVHARIETLLRRSLSIAQARRTESLAFASRYSIGLPAHVMESYIDRFANDDTMTLRLDCRAALSTLFERLRCSGLAPALPQSARDEIGGLSHVA